MPFERERSVYNAAFTLNSIHFRIGHVQRKKKENKSLFSLNSALVYFFIFVSSLCVSVILLCSPRLFIYMLWLFFRVYARCACEPGVVCENCVLLVRDKFMVWLLLRLLLPEATEKKEWSKIAEDNQNRNYQNNGMNDTHTQCVCHCLPF